MSEERMLTVREAAEYLNLSVWTVRTRLTQGRIVGVRLGPGYNWRIPLGQLQATLQAHSSRREVPVG